MNNNLDLIRYRELRDILENSKKSFSKAEAIEFVSYGAAVERQICYNRKYEYLSLIEEYLAERINPGTFRYEFLEMEREDFRTANIIKKDFKQLSTFSIDLKSEEFSSLIDKISNCCFIAIEFDLEDINFDLEDINGINEDEFRDRIKNIFFQIKTSLDK